MLRTGMIEMSRTERVAVDKLLLDLGEPKAGVSRADPGEKGPLHVKYDGRVWEIAADGTTSEVKKDG